jgi:cell division cycle protein 37
MSKGFNYSKWDNIVVSSDDDADCHPNIDKMSWRRLRSRQRDETKTTEDAQIAEWAVENVGLGERIARTTAALATATAEGSEDAKVLRTKLLKMETKLGSNKKEAAKILRMRKMSPDEMCVVKDDRTVMSAKSAAPPADAKIGGELGNSDEYDAFVKAYKGDVDKYCFLNSPMQSQQCLMACPQLLNDNATGYMLLKCLELEMTGKGSKMKHVAGQYLQLQYVLDLAKQSRRDPRESVAPFFAKIAGGSATSVAAFTKEVNDFAGKIRQRAIVKKKEEADQKALAVEMGDPEGRYEYVEVPEEERLGPGGLDPIKVFETLPLSMQEAFQAKDTEKLQAALDAMPREEAARHLEQCIASGLWNPEGPGGAEEEGGAAASSGGGASSAAPPAPPAPAAAAAAAEVEEQLE